MPAALRYNLLRRAVHHPSPPRVFLRPIILSLRLVTTTCLFVRYAKNDSGTWLLHSPDALSLYDDRLTCDCGRNSLGSVQNLGFPPVNLKYIFSQFYAIYCSTRLQFVVYEVRKCSFEN